MGVELSRLTPTEGKRKARTPLVFRGVRTFTVGGR